MSQSIFKSAKRQFNKRYTSRGKPKFSQIASDVRLLKSLVNAEVRIFDTGFGVTNVPNSMTRTNLSLITQGTDYLNRSGNSIRIKSLELLLWLKIGTAATSGSVIRVIITADTQRISNVNTPIGTDLLEVNASQNGIISPYNHTQESDGANRFIVLFDDLISLSQTGPQMVAIHKSFQFNKHMYFNGTTGTEASMGEQCIDMWIGGSESVNLATYNGYARLSFYDN